MSTNQYNRFTVTAALPYANGPKHIGHLAGAYIPSDVYVRYLRLSGKDVIYVCGSDEHGTAIPNQALKEQTTPQAIIDKYDALIRECFDKLGISFDIYHRTSEAIHHQTSQEFFLTLYNKGLLSEEVSEQYFDEEAKVFLADRYIVGTCPKCGHTNAYGDQCEKCGSTLSPRELINPRSTLSGKTPILKPTRHWYLPLEKYEPWLRDWILKSHQHDWKPNVFGQCKSWIEAGLQPRAMTRDLDWGIKVPLPDAEGKVLYVWFDAPIGYISATRALFDEITSGNRKYATPRSDFSKADKDDWKKYWQAKDTRLIHFIGKDNIVFHCIIFPAMLMEHGDFILADNVPANEFLNLEGDKISTSRNWAVWLHEYLIDFKDKQDVLRYTLCSNAPETKDNDFTWADFQTKNNSELVAILGNFVNRTLVLTHKYYNGHVPASDTYTKDDLLILEQLATFPDKIATSLEQFKFREALSEMMNLARLGNKYLADTEPWKLIKTDEQRVKTIMNIALQITCNLAIVCEPFIPFTSAKLFTMLNMPTLKWHAAKQTNNMAAEHKINKEELLFAKIEDTEIQAQIDKLETSKKLNLTSTVSITPAKAETSFDDFSKMDIRTGTILEAERVPKTDKLLKLKIDTGIDVRTVVSGIAEWYKPEAIIGQQVSILVNLAPRKIKGIESQGMILMASNSAGELSFISPTKTGFNNGSEIK